MAKIANRNKKQNDASTALRVLPKPVCMWCEKVKSLNHTRALFAVINEKVILCHGCDEDLSHDAPASA